MNVTTKFMLIIVAVIQIATVGSADARSSRRSTTDFDGSWHLSFMTRSGPCDLSYDFDVNVSNGMISHPNLVRFRGRVAPGGAVSASVGVQDKFAAGSGRLSRAAGRGTWKGRSGSGACAGDWTAQRG